jgi:hypothetical protein
MGAVVTALCRNYMKRIAHKRSSTYQDLSTSNRDVVRVQGATDWWVLGRKNCPGRINVRDEEVPWHCRQNINELI